MDRGAGGLYYQNFDESGNMLIHRAALHNNLVIPVRAIVFPKFCLSLLGGVYMKNMLGKTVTSDRVYTFWVEPDGSKVPAFDENTKFYALDKKPVWGYEVGFAWNRPVGKTRQLPVLNAIAAALAAANGIWGE